jgi:hypothetical protein
MNIIFTINGGIGKVIAATAVCAAIKKKYPEDKLIVVSGYPEVFINNPNVYKSFAFGQTHYFYRDYIEEGNFLLFAHDPYMDSKHIKGEEHLIETWCRMYDLPTVKITGELFLNKREIDFYSKKYSSDKPILLIQPNGGGQNELKYSWARDLPQHIVHGIIAEFRSQYNIVHIRRDDQIQYDGAFGVQDNFRGLLVLITISEKRLLIDSFAQHAAAALGKQSVVTWICNKPNVFGYEIHKNITANTETIHPDLRNSFYNKYNIAGDLNEFPYNDEREIFDLEKIVNALK